ncbi:helix-turn-helix domain-containing protein [Amycolatopsis sp., V23-08]|uniref:Helix-turn-helix domain-containing protein n=1 Tax=Amycolatopsis heterodermiae TaxID=3110235 RepID=A0ABU5RM54_9PSEU|nr:helix-turn-helix domain-containing protein [Amycolatopsis sp., V23-08]MEA5367381.1 helix-turn-helix domain-containing protein [Amycolatopsis sp., V23-08]
MDVISTAEAPDGEGFAYWREVNAKLWAPYDLRCDPRGESAFRAQVGISDFGAVQATLGCFGRGGGLMRQDGQCAEYGVGDLKLYDTSRPFGGEFAPDVPTSQLLLLRFPRSLLPLPAKDLRQLTAVRIPGSSGVGALSSQFLLHLARHLHELDPADAARLSTLTVDVLMAALAHALDAQSTVPPGTRRRALLARIHAFIRANLGDGDLAPETIAAAHHISLRYLHSLFHQDGHTVGGWIRRRRLEQCRRDLAEPRLSARPINAVAARWGFGSPAHFSQVFRGAYGLSPSEYRRQCAAETGKR